MLPSVFSEPLFRDGSICHLVDRPIVHQFENAVDAVDIGCEGAGRWSMRAAPAPWAAVIRNKQLRR
jgi:hypothetical protein